ncbi:MAG: hypothetical protein ACJASQ_001190 [Crocinitomicaceae bacterium]|jgi:hypothetical protein
MPAKLINSALSDTFLSDNHAVIDEIIITERGGAVKSLNH